MSETITKACPYANIVRHDDLCPLCRDDLHRGLMEANTKYHEAQLAERDAELATARAEVERLTAREREAKWLFDSLPPFHFTPIFYEHRDAWLAGCKP